MGKRRWAFVVWLMSSLAGCAVARGSSRRSACDADNRLRPCQCERHQVLTAAAGVELALVDNNDDPGAPRGWSKHGLSADGRWLAYTTKPGSGRIDVMPTCGGAAVTVHHGPGWAQFDQNVLEIFGPPDGAHPRDGDYAPYLAIWRPGDRGAQRVPQLVDVDPGATRVSRDGRWLRTEANDRPLDGSDGVMITLVDLASLTATDLGYTVRGRARFTRDSSRLVFGGSGGNGDNAHQFSIELNGESPRVDLGASAWPASFQLGSDSRSAVLMTDDAALVRTDLVDRGRRVLASGTSSSPGEATDDDSMAFQVSSDRDRVAVVINRDQQDRLRTVALDDSEPAGTAGVDAPTRIRIKDFLEEAVVYRLGKKDDGAPRTWQALPLSGPGAEPVDLGTEADGDLIAGDKALLALGVDGTLVAHTFHPDHRAVTVAHGVTAAMLVEPNRVVYLDEAHQLWVVKLASAGTIKTYPALEQHVVGGFAVRGFWYVAVIEQDGGRALVVGPLP